ncbi:hypothetical protein NDU88_007556 [Pleurodeles waltl]|uniref:Uncharacterized protein n=1 Tax=Pleurodeles waltl TaxID=8319 RepID=A0AAV7NTF8_PLEWA|nr:hypothetical protein NDU88_007556 [Pleurodeles waltl]
MGKTGRQKDAEQKNGASAEALAGLRGTKNTLPEENNGDPTLQDVLQAITASGKALEGKTDALASDFTVLRDDHRHLAERLATTDKQIKELLPEVKDTTKVAQQMEKRIRNLELRAEDTEIIFE